MRWIVFGVVMLACACDPGSKAQIDAVGDKECRVQLTSREDGYKIDVSFECAGPDHTKCYAITRMKCSNTDIPVTAPRPVTGCPGKDHCIDDCKAVDAPGTIWDTPALLKEKGCSVYSK